MYPSQRGQRRAYSMNMVTEKSRPMHLIRKNDNVSSVIIRSRKSRSAEQRLERCTLNADTVHRIQFF